jgi:hypothetical protein
VIARTPASVRSAANPWVSRFRTAFASLTTNPWKPQVSRSTSVNNQWLPEAGIPFRSMYAVMMFPAPASTAARNGGRYTFHSSAPERFTSS